MKAIKPPAYKDEEQQDNELYLKSLFSSLTLPERNPTAPDEKYIPDGFDSVEDYLEDMRDTYKMDIEADQDNRDAAIEDLKFVAGEQWDPIVLQQRAGLPCLTLNTIPQFVSQLVGDWRTNQTSVKVQPVDSGTQDIADVRTDLIRSIETQSRADRVYNNAFESMVQCGDGAFRVAVQYAGEDVFDQEIGIAKIDDPLSVVWDRVSIDETGRDANHCFVDDILPKKEFEARWPDKDPSDLNTKIEKLMTAGGWCDQHTVRVTEHWRLIERERTLVLFKDGTIFDATELGKVKGEHIDQFYQKHGEPVKTRVAPCTYAQMHLVTGWDILAGPYEYKMTRLPIIRMAGRTITVQDRRVRYGLVRHMKDAARLRNFWRSIAAEQLGYAPKAQWLAPESAVEGREDLFRKAHLTRDPLLIYNDDALAPPERIEPPTVQQALLNEAEINSQDMKDITGIQDAGLGIKSNETSGRAIMARQREGDVASIIYYDNGNAAILEAGDVMNQLIPQIYDGTRIVRIIGQDESSKLVNINDPEDPKSPNLATGRYDVAISTGPSYTTRRVEAAEAMMEAIQVFPQLMQVAGDLVVKAQDWPGADELAERLLKTVPSQLLSPKEQEEQGQQVDVQQIQQQQQQVQQQMQQMQAELTKVQNENLLLRTKADVEMQKLEIDRYNAETQRMDAYAQLELAKAGTQIQALETEAKAQLEGNAQAHAQKMDAANLMQDQHQFNQGQQADSDQGASDQVHQLVQTAMDQQHQANQAEQDRQHNLQVAAAQAKISNQKKPPSSSD